MLRMFRRVPVSSSARFKLSKYLAMAPGYLLTSDNQTTWTKRPYPADLGTINDVIVNPAGIIVPVNSNFQRYTSSDLINWTLKSTTAWPGTNMNDGIFAFNKFILIDQRIFSSTDGNVFTEVSQSAFSQFDVLKAIKFNGEVAVIVGGSGNGNGAVVSWSSDGTTWNPVNLNTNFFGSNSGFSDIAYGNGMFVAGGLNGKMGYSTDNGKTWNLGSIPGSVSIISVTFGYGYFCALSENGNLYYSTNGATWTSIGIPTAVKNQMSSYSDITFCNDTFLLSGASVTGNCGIIFAAPDFQTWVKVYQDTDFSSKIIRTRGL